MHNMLENILTRKKEDLKVHSRVALRDTISASPKTFINAIIQSKTPAILAEIKFASPTHPQLGIATDLLTRATMYEQGGVAAISIITEKHFFKGDPLFVQQVKQTVQVPILQKDFIIDEAQIYEAKRVGSDALLLIARIIDGKTLQKFVELCLRLSIEPVVEIANKKDLAKAVQTNTRIIAVNARDLDTFIVDVKHACDLLHMIPNSYIPLGFSGIQTKKEVTQYVAAGARGVLIGTSIMRAKDPKTFLRSLQ